MDVKLLNSTDEFDGDDDDRLALRLSLPSAPPSPLLSLGQPNTQPDLHQSPPPLPLLPLSMDTFLPPSFLQLQPPLPESSQPPTRQAARSKRNLPGNGKPEKINPPYPWSSDRRATVLPLETLMETGIEVVYGEVQCKRCDFKMVMQHRLWEKFTAVAAKVAAAEKDERRSGGSSAPPEWLNPNFPPCPSCERENCMRPVVAGKKREINWLFMLLGQTIGTCTVEQLRYFCKHQRKHRTGTKCRVLYTTYLGLCRQLDPKGNFDN